MISTREKLRSVTINKRKIGSQHPTYFIAEIGGNFSSYEEGIKFIKAAISSGADAVKLQTFTAEKIASKYATFDMPGIGGKKNQLKIMRKLELDFNIQKKLIDYCKSRNITIFSTPSHKEDVEFLEENNICAYKIGSDDMTNLPLVKHISRLQKPTIISTGMANLQEVKDTVEAFYSTGNKDLILLHCVSMYPFEPKYANLRAINTMQELFKIPIGWSDHTKGTEICMAAATLGANVIEKHFTLDKNAPGPDHVLSATPQEFSILTKSIRMIESAKGTGRKERAECEKRTVKDIRKSLVASKDIPKESIITEDMLEIKRPGTGISPKEIQKIVGRITRVKIPMDMPITYDHLK